jgi:short-subunit dehydrogenase
VSRCSPKNTDTEFFDHADISKDNKLYAQKARVSAKSVAHDAVEKMFEAKLSSIHGLKINALAMLNRLSPSRKFTAGISKKLVSKYS